MILAESPALLERFWPRSSPGADAGSPDADAAPPGTASIAAALGCAPDLAPRKATLPPPFDLLVLREHAERSQLDALLAATRAASDELPTAAAVATTGVGFHGHQGRSWATSAGNLHLSVLLHPRRALPHAGAAYMALPGVATLEVVAALLPKSAPVPRLKWVNDVLVDGAKIAGVITTSRSLGMRLEHVVLGVGLNVEVSPQVAPDRFVPAVTSLSAHGARPPLHSVLTLLLERLAYWHQRVLEEGAAPLLDAYRTHAERPGEPIQLWDGDTLLADGKLARIGDDLELWLDGESAPRTQGRLALR